MQQVGFYLTTMTEEYAICETEELMPDAKQIPQGALYVKLKTAVQKDLSQILSNLYNTGKIKYSKTLNDILITIDNE